MSPNDLFNRHRDRLAADNARLAAENAALRTERDAYATAALVGLSGLVCTPEKGYVKDGGPGLFKSDLMRFRRQYERLAAERDDLLAGCRAFLTAMRDNAAVPAPEPLIRALVEAMTVVVPAVHKAEGRTDS